MRQRRAAPPSKPNKALNWFDFFLIILFLLCTLTAFLTGAWLGDRSEGEEGRVVYTVLLSEIEASINVSSYLSDGEIVKNENGTLTMGEIIAVEDKAHQVPDARGGKVVFVPSSEYVDYYVTVSSNAVRRKGDGIRIGDVRIAAGDGMHLRFGAFMHYGARIIHVRWEESEYEAETIGHD
jgi:hypothetical protein